MEWASVPSISACAAICSPQLLDLARPSHPEGTHTLWEMCITKRAISLDSATPWCPSYPAVVVPQVSETDGRSVSLVQFLADQRSLRRRGLEWWGLSIFTLAGQRPTKKVHVKAIEGREWPSNMNICKTHTTPNFQKSFGTGILSGTRTTFKSHQSWELIIFRY